MPFVLNVTISVNKEELCETIERAVMEALQDDAEDFFEVEVTCDDDADISPELIKPQKTRR